MWTNWIATDKAILGKMGGVYVTYEAAVDKQHVCTLVWSFKIFSLGSFNRLTHIYTGVTNIATSFTFKESIKLIKFTTAQYVLVTNYQVMMENLFYQLSVINGADKIK